jgi:hypothetical protein
VLEVIGDRWLDESRPGPGDAVGGETDVEAERADLLEDECVGKTNGVGLSRARFEEAAEHSLVAVPGVTKGRRRASW